MSTLIRTLFIAVLVVFMALVLILLAAGLVEGFIWLSGLLGLQHALGEDTQTSKNYASASGVIPVVVASLGFSGVLVTAWRHINCEQQGCLRPGHRHPDHGRPVCKHHYHHDLVPEKR